MKSYVTVFKNKNIYLHSDKDNVYQTPKKCKIESDEKVTSYVPHLEISIYGEFITLQSCSAYHMTV